MEIYLSHTAKDKKFAAELREELVNAGLRVWNPETQIAPGANWLAVSGRALARADAIVFLLSREAVRSESIQKEIDYALTNARFKGRLIPVVIGSPSNIPWILETLPTIEAERSDEPSEIARQIVGLLPKKAAAVADHGRTRVKAQV
jgi:hypothetical protein